MGLAGDGGLLDRRPGGGAVEVPLKNQAPRAAQRAELVAGGSGGAGGRFAADDQCDRDRQVRSELAAGVCAGADFQVED